MLDMLMLPIVLMTLNLKMPQWPSLCMMGEILTLFDVGVNRIVAHNTSELQHNVNA